MKSKVLVCAYSCVSESGVKNIGGEAGLGFNMVKQLSGFSEVFVLTHSHNQSAIELELQKSPLPNVTFFYLALPSFLRFLEFSHVGGIQLYTYLWQIKAYFVSKKLHTANHFDLFHHITYANDWMASFIGALLPVPYIRGPGGGAHRVPGSFLKIYSFSDQLKDKARNIGQWMFRHDPFFILGQKRAKAILVCNAEAFEALPKPWQKKAHFFPVNGISKEELYQLEALPKKKSADFTVLSAGKLMKIKGFDLAIKSFKVLSDKNHHAKLVIVGNGPELENLKALRKTLHLEDNIIFTGWLPKEELLEQMASCDVFLFASLRDGGGAVVVEAMASGKPVICFDIAGPAFHIDNTCGIKIKPDNPDQAIADMAKAMVYLSENKTVAEQLGEGGKAKIQSQYTWDVLGQKLQTIYSEVLHK